MKRIRPEAAAWYTLADSARLSLVAGCRGVIGDSSRADPLAVVVTETACFGAAPRVGLSVALE